MHYKHKQLHKLTGLALLLPFLAWSLTGIFFLFRPPFFEAYEQIPIKHYPLQTSSINIDSDTWLEARQVRSILGDHLLVRNSDEWVHLNAETNEIWEFPSDDQITLLIHDAFEFNPDRYGSLIELNGGEGTTDTGIDIEIDWFSLTITQEGADRIWIDRIYNLHYLRWTGIEWLDEIVGVLALCLLVYMTYSGARMVLITKQ